VSEMHLRHRAASNVTVSSRARSELHGSHSIDFRFPQKQRKRHFWCATAFSYVGQSFITVSEDST